MKSDRRSFIGEATVIAGVTTVAYLSALAYRAGDFVRLGLPITLSTVRLTDAAFAGLYVLLGGLTLLVVFDAVESTTPGLLDRIFRTYLVVVAALAALPVVMFLILVFVVAYEIYGWISVLLVVVGLVALSLGLRLAIRRLGASRLRLDLLASLLRRHPAVTMALIASTLLCFGAFSLGFGGLSLPFKRYPRTQNGQEVAVAIFEDRVILAGVTGSPASVEATLTGGFRVVPLPTDEVTFGSVPVRRLHRQ